jgi:hypothetical protein
MPTASSRGRTNSEIRCGRGGFRSCPARFSSSDYRVWHRSTINPWVTSRIWTVGVILTPVLVLDLAPQLEVVDGPRIGRRLCSGADPELAKHVVDVVLDRVQCNVQPVCDLLVG